MDETAPSLEQEYPLVRPYSHYARLYDELGQSEFGLALVPLVELAVRRHRVPVRRVLDLACGTGTVALHMALRGYEVIGVDRSPEMLKVAMEKGALVGRPITFLRQNMARLQLSQTVDLVLCLYDSLNHLLTVRHLEATLAAISRALNPGGLFVFDVNTIHSLANDWGNRVEEERCASAMLAHLYRYNPNTRIGTLKVVCLLNREGCIEKFAEVHRERGYAREEIAGALRHSGLSCLEELAFPDLGRPNDNTSRLIYVVRKPAQDSGKLEQTP